MQTSYISSQNNAFGNQWHIRSVSQKNNTPQETKKDSAIATLFQYISSLSGMTLTNEEKAKLQMAFKHKIVKRKQYLLQEGDVCKHLYFVVHGALRMYSVNERGQEAIVSFNAEGDWCSDRESIALMEPSGFNIEAIEHSEVLQVSASQLENLSLHIPAVCEMIKKQYKIYAIETQNRIHTAISMTAEERYQNLIEFYPEIAKRFPKNMVACYLGIQPETLSRLRKK